MRAILPVAALAAGFALVLAGCGSGRVPQPDVSARQVAGVATTEITGPAGRLAESLARASAARRIAPAPGGDVRFRMIQYSPVITNAGSPGGYAVFVQQARSVVVLPSSAATLSISGDGPARFLTPAARAAWQAAGKPALPHFPGKPVTASVPAGTWSFLPQGKVLTYQAAESLPATAVALSSQVRALTGSRPPATQMLTQLGYLLAAAPLTAAGRTAAWMSVATLPGLRLCAPATDLVGRSGTTLCVSAAGQETDLVVNPSSGSVLAVQDRLLQQDAAYPGISPGTVLQSTTFTGGP